MLIEVAENENIVFNLYKLKNPKLINFAKNNLDNTGVLEFDEKNSYCYLKIHDDFIYKLYPLLHEMNVTLPNYFNTKNAIGAHITVIYNEELKNVEMKNEKSKDKDKNKDKIKIQEVGNIFSFMPDDLYCIEVFNKLMVVLIVNTQELASLRKKYQLSEKLNYHGLLVPFHITIATRIL